VDIGIALRDHSDATCPPNPGNSKVVHLGLRALAALLLAVSGVADFFIDSTYTDAQGRKRLTRLGVVKVCAIATGFVLFIVGEYTSHVRDESRTKAQADEIERLKTIDDQQRRQILATSELSNRARRLDIGRATLHGLRATWTAPDKDHLTNPAWAMTLSTIVSAGDRTGDGFAVRNLAEWLRQCAPPFMECVVEANPAAQLFSGGVTPVLPRAGSTLAHLMNS
jgi:hypothetical protein